MAASLALVAAVVFRKTRSTGLSTLDGILLGAACIPLVQAAIGLIPFWGQAWTASAYLLGLLAAVLLGRQWTLWKPVWMGNILFGAVLAASIVSTGMALYQWLGMAQDRGLMDIWVIGLAQDRPYANLGQPNQLATLLLWGLVSCGWFAWQRQIGVGVACVGALWIVLGLALTQSRSGFLGLCAIVLAVWWWRRLWSNPNTAKYVMALVPAYFLSYAAAGFLSSLLMLDLPNSALLRTMGEVRPALWAAAVDAALQEPWLGYGWNGVLNAHLAVAERHRELPTLFGHTHNLFLDLVIWCGVPLGVMLSAVCVAWVWQAGRRVNDSSQAIYFIFLVPVGLHAMLELPLHYAYFLLPAGLAMGALSGQLRIWEFAAPTRRGWLAAVGVLAGASLVLTLIIRDYFEVEGAVRDARMKLARIRMDKPPAPPDVVLLGQFRTLLDLELLEPAENRSPEQVQAARDLTVSVVNYRTLSGLPVVLALNGHVPEARCWMSKAHALVAPESRAHLLEDWREAQKRHPALRSVEWPASHEPAVCDAVRRSPLGPWPQLR